MSGIRLHAHASVWSFRGDKKETRRDGMFQQREIPSYTLEIFIVYQGTERGQRIALAAFNSVTRLSFPERNSEKFRKIPAKFREKFGKINGGTGAGCLAGIFQFCRNSWTGNERMGAWKVRVPTGGNKSSVVNKLTRCLSDLCSPTPPLRPVNCYTHICVYGRRKRVL